MRIPSAGVLLTEGQNYRVVGVVYYVRYFDLERDTSQEMYMLLRQTGNYQTVDLVVRSAVPTAGLIPAIRLALKRADSTLPGVEFRTMDQLLDRSVLIRRLIVLLLAGFAGFALILASLGLYAVISYAVSQRTREIGVRMALGASPLVMQRTILAQTITLAAIGLAIGLPAAWIAAKTIQHNALRRRLVGPADVRRRCRRCRHRRWAQRLCAGKTGIANRSRAGSAVGIGHGVRALKLQNPHAPCGTRLL